MISIGILSYQRTDLLLQTLEDLVFISTPVELIILNNNEELDIIDEVVNIISKNKNIILNYIWDKCNYGVSSGRRRLIDACQSSWMILLDDDVAVPDINGVICSVINAFERDIKLSAIAFNIVEYESKVANRYEIPHKNKQIDLASEFDTYLIIGAGNALKVADVKSVGNFSDDFGLYGFEEIDLAFRLINAGGRIRYLPSCMVQHKKSPDGRFSNNYVSTQGYVNRMIMARRYLSFQYVVSCFLIRTIFLLKQTKNIVPVISAIRLSFRSVEIKKFDKNFYDYIKKVDGFLWW